jgi:hypothetical protein
MNALKSVTSVALIVAALTNLSGCIVDREHERPREEVRYDEHYCDEGRGHEHEEHCHR